MINTNIQQSITVQKYIKSMCSLLSMYYPNMREEDFIEPLQYSVSKRYKEEPLTLYNNYKNKEVDMNILLLCDYIEKRKPIVTSWGTLYKKHGEEPNPMGLVIQKFLDERSIYKNKMFEYPKGSEDFEKYNLLQQLAKIDCNAIYGLLGAPTSLVFNINVSPSITRMGQSLVSSAGMLFEMVLANNVKFGSLEQVLTYIDNIKKEKRSRTFKDSDILKENVDAGQVFGHLVLTCGYRWIPNEEEMEIIWRVVNNLSQEDLNRVYFKNNLYEFMEKSIVKNMVKELLHMLDEPYLNPLKPPKKIKVELDFFVDIMKEFVYYKYMIPDRIDRMDNMIKSVCLISDTDSTIISMDPWFRYMLNEVKGEDMKILHQNLDLVEIVDKDEFGDLPDSFFDMIHFTEPTLDYDFYEDDIIVNEHLIEPFTIHPQDNLRYSIINIMAYFLDNIINDYMEEFTKYSGSYAEGKPCKIIMKNEFLFRTTLMTDVKKSYATLQELQEGHIVPKDEQLDIKGIASMAKSSMAKSTRDALKRILYEDILNTGEINQLKVIKDLAIENKKIYNSLQLGSKDYYKPVVIKAENNYDDPMRIQGIKASYAWNLLKEDNLPSINLEERNSIDIAKVAISVKTIERIKDISPDVYDNAMNNIFNVSDNPFKGEVNSIAIPKDIEPPKWVRELLDYNTIISNNLSGFPLESVGIQKFAPNNVYTNIVQL